METRSVLDCPRWTGPPRRDGVRGERRLSLEFFPGGPPEDLYRVYARPMPRRETSSR